MSGWGWPESLSSCHPQVYPQPQPEGFLEEEASVLEGPEEEPVVFHHHYLPCPMPMLGLLPPWPAPISSPPPHQPPLQDTSRIQEYPPAFGKRRV